MMVDPNCRVCIIQEVKYNLIRRSYFQPGVSFMPLNVEKIRAICFDVDGTLSDTDDLFVHRLEQILRPVHFLLPHHDPQRAARRLVMWSEAPGNFLIGFPDTLGVDDEIAAVMEWLNRQRPRPLKQFLLIPGVTEMLAQLSLRYPLAVVSAREARSTVAFLDYFKLTPFFQVIVTGQTAEHTKPYPDPIFYAAQTLKVPPESCLMVGDTSVDIRSGKAAQAQTVGVLCGFGEEPELRRNGADMILSSTAELVSLLNA
jgi:haloacid dehalogenase superfamily, subfamily IA, variant 3 with third motif having DD or ED/haloacid dehalogenase superfamily, subfamily IA, variant 1 with third motif having Dx(3-4)D or Dx(3-4)E